LTTAAFAAGLMAAENSDPLIGFALLYHFHASQCKKPADKQFLGGPEVLKKPGAVCLITSEKTVAISKRRRFLTPKFCCESKKGM